LVLRGFPFWLEEKTMAIEDFANCYVNKVGGDVDLVIEACQKIGIDNIRAIVAAAAAAGLGAMTLLALEAWVAANLGIAAWEGIVLLLGAASWGAILDGFVSCVGQL
jgi:hypothetical protein